MRQVVKMMALVVAMTATATAVQPDATIHGDRLPASHSSLKPTAEADPTQLTYYGHTDFGNVSQPTSFGYPLQFVSLGNWSEPKSYFDPRQYAPFGEVWPFRSEAEPLKSEPKARQPAAIDHTETPNSYSAPRRLKPLIVKPSIARIQFNTPVLAPMAHTMFCLQYPSDCRVRKIVFRGGAVKLTAERRAELERINSEVNRAIIPERNVEGLAGEKWLISPRSGDCNDYAVTKRHKLLVRGWPARALLLSEVVTSWGEHHLVLVVRTQDGDFVADNLNPKIRSWSKAPYQWVRIQSPNSPVFWSSVANAAA